MTRRCHNGLNAENQYQMSQTLNYNKYTELDTSLDHCLEVVLKLIQNDLAVYMYICMQISYRIPISCLTFYSVALLLPLKTLLPGAAGTGRTNYGKSRYKKHVFEMEL